MLWPRLNSTGKFAAEYLGRWPRKLHMLISISARGGCVREIDSWRKISFTRLAVSARPVGADQEIALADHILVVIDRGAGDFDVLRQGQEDADLDRCS